MQNAGEGLINSVVGEQREVGEFQSPPGSRGSLGSSNAVRNTDYNLLTQASLGPT
jgi:hypothetical protein